MTLPGAGLQAPALYCTSGSSIPRWLRMLSGLAQASFMNPGYSHGLEWGMDKLLGSFLLEKSSPFLERECTRFKGQQSDTL